MNTLGDEQVRWRFLGKAYDTVFFGIVYVPVRRRTWNIVEDHFRWRAQLLGHCEMQRINA